MLQLLAFCREVGRVLAAPNSPDVVRKELSSRPEIVKVQGAKLVADPHQQQVLCMMPTHWMYTSYLCCNV